MKTIHILCACCLAVVVASCAKDTLKEASEGVRYDRNITEIKFENQIGVAKIERTETAATVTFSYNLDATGSLQIPVLSFVTSVGASAGILPGDLLDFDNPSRSVQVVVMPQSGEPLEWTIQMKPFTEPLRGVWKIESMWLYGGVDRGEWGGADYKSFEGVINTLFTGDNLPQHELDNTYTFDVTGFTSTGNAYGTITNDAGADGRYAEYKYAGADADGEVLDCERIYRKVALPGGKWEHDTTLDVYYFRDASDRLIATGTFRAQAFTYKYGPHSANKDFPANTLVFDVSALGLSIGNWNKNYTTVGIVACDPLAYLISLKK